MDLYTPQKRMNSAIRLWKLADSKYFKYDEFMTYLNATIQEIRNITFTLQKLKGSIKDFDIWYKTWQNKMKSDSILSWCSNARTIIVKEQDLEAFSVTKVIVKNYINHDSFLMIYDVPKFISTQELTKAAKFRLISKYGFIDKSIFIEIERKWVVEAFPNEDILNLLSISIGKLYPLILEYIEKLKLNNIIIDKFITNDNEYRFASSISKSDKRTEYINLSNGLEMKMGSKQLKYDRKNTEELKQRYGEMKLDKNVTDVEFFNQLCRLCERLLIVDKGLLTVIWTKSYENEWTMMRVEFFGKETKYLFFTQLAKKVNNERIKAVIFCTESWIRSENQEKNEGFSLSYINENLKVMTLLKSFSRDNNGNITIGSSYDSDIEVGIFEPIRKVFISRLKVFR